jgi:hypothetical protein
VQDFSEKARFRVNLARGLAALIFVFAPARAAESGLPDVTDPVAGMGVNIHFTNPRPGDLEMLAQAGFRWVRMDLNWTWTEKQAGIYDFSAFDRLMARLDQFHLRALFILDYANPLYDQGKPSCTDAGRRAFANWAVAAVNHFKGRGIIWEIWNEPNGAWFWKPKVNAADYAQLALTVSAAIHDAAPDEIVVGPALSGPDMKFLDVVAGSGVLNFWSAVTIHPYCRTGPETYGSVYASSRAIIQKHLAPGQKVGLICGESGYSTTWHGLDDALQGKYLARLFLSDVLDGIPLTIWYDWHDDGPDPGNSEHNFGTVGYEYLAGASPVYLPKPAYAAAKTYSTQLAGTHFVARLKSDSPDDYLLSFTGSAGSCVVAWTTAANPHEVKIPLPDGPYRVTGFDGQEQAPVQASGGAAELTLDAGPQYLKK